MSLPSQEVLNDIKDLISKITGFQEHDENFSICERYCFSHVVHHTYPSVNRTTVKDTVNSYVSRFYGHGYFTVSQELHYQVNRFLSNEKLFEKNPQYDIQWCLLSLMSSLSSNLSSVKEIPELLPIDDEEIEVDDFDWKEYLMKDLPYNVSYTLNSENEESSMDGNNEEEKEENNIDENERNNDSFSTKSANSSKNEELCQSKKQLEVIFDNKTLFSTESFSKIRKESIEEFLKNRSCERYLENDFNIRGNFTDTFDQLMYQEGILRKSQIISEYELMENILFQFETGEKIFLRKGLVNPALTSLTQDTLGAYLESLQLYFTVIRSFKDFDAEVMKARYPESSLEKSLSCSNSYQLSTVMDRDLCKKKIIPNVLYMYNVMLKKALEPFQNEISKIVENLENYTLIQMEQKLRPYYWDLTSLFHTHNSATKNWKKDCNWKSSVRILCVLYNAIVDATSRKMNFLYLNFFLQCFQVYLDIIDNWVSFVDLIDPKNEFVIAKSTGERNSENECTEYEIRPYKTEIENLGIGRVAVLEFISDKMIHVGQSLEVLKNLNSFIAQDKQTSKETSYQLLIKAIDKKIQALGKVNCVPKKLKIPEKQKGVFTVKNVSLGLEKDNGGGDSSLIGNLLIKILENEEKIKGDTEFKVEIKSDKKFNYCGELINFMVENQFFKMAFESAGMKQVQKQLNKAKARVKEGSGNDPLMIIRKPEDEKSAIYPLHKIITEAFQEILVNRVSSTCTSVKNIVLKECSLSTHLCLLRSILLFNDSYLLQPFILALFTQPFIWKSPFSLTLHLKECARGFYKNYADALSVNFSKNLSTDFDNILEVIDDININYEIQWPVTLIITPEAMRKYNEIFRLALKLKWSHWALCSLHFQGKVQKGSKSIRHRLHLLRFWLLSALGRVNNYFLTQMTPLDLELDTCQDLNDIICAHSEFLNKIYRNCLFGEKSSEGRKLILETLIPLCMDVLQESYDVDEAKLSSIENTFGNCHLLLSHLLSSLEK